MAEDKDGKIHPINVLNKPTYSTPMGSSFVPYIPIGTSLALRALQTGITGCPALFLDFPILSHHYVKSEKLLDNEEWEIVDIEDTCLKEPDKTNKCL